MRPKLVPAVLASVLAVSLLSIAPSTAGGELRVVSQPQDAGIRSEDFRPFYRAQREQAWCWAACIEMVLDHAGVNVNQSAIVTQVYGTDWNGKPPNAPGSCQQLSRLLNQWGLDDDGDQFVVYSRGGRGVPVPAWLVGEVEQGHPVIVLFYPLPGQPIGHFVVITAVTYVDTPNGPGVSGLVIWDPYPYEAVGSRPPAFYQKTRPMSGRYYVPAQALMSTTKFHFFTRAHDGDDFDWPDY